MGKIYTANAVYASDEIGSDPHQLVNKEYVDNAVAAGLHVHAPVRVEEGNNLSAVYTNGGTTPTVTAIASNSVLTSVGHNLSENDMIIFTASGNGIIAGDTYFAFQILGADTFNISHTLNGPAIATLTDGTGLTLTSRANSGVGATLVNSGAQAALVLSTIPMVVGNRVMIQGQTNGFENGVYTVTSIGSISTNWVLTRATDANKYNSNSPDALGEGDYFFVNEGIPGAGESYVLSTPGEIVFGTTSIVFTKFSASPAYTGTAPLNVTGQLISISQANTSTDGYLSSTDWNTFNSRANASGTTNYVPKFTGASTLGNSLIFDNGTNVGIGTTNPSAKLHLSSSASDFIRMTRGSADYMFQLAGTDLYLLNNTTTTYALTVLNSGNIGIGTTTPYGKLVVNNGVDRNVFITSDALLGGTTGMAIASLLDSTADFMPLTILGSKISLKATGGVLINTTTDNGVDKLQVNGSATFGSSITIQNGNALTLNNSANTGAGSVICPGGGSLALRSYGNDMIYLNENSDIRFSTSSSEKMRITSGGNVGMGTTSPNRKLEIVSGDSEQLVLTSTSTSNLAGIFLNPANTTFSSFIGGTGNDIVMNTVGAEKMRITSGGNVGIGTTTPNNILEIRKDQAADTAFWINNRNSTSSGSTNSLIFGGYRDSDPSHQVAKISVIKTPSSAAGDLEQRGDLAFYTQPATANTTPEIPLERMRITSGGNVGIGTTSPTQLLDITKTSNNAVINLDGLSSATTGILFKGSGTERGRITFGNSNDMAFSVGNSSNERMRITSAGNVLINTTTDNGADKLQVNGSGSFSGGMQASLLKINGIVSIDANNTTTGYNTDLYGLFSRARGNSAGISGSTYVAQLLSSTGVEGFEIYTPNAKPLALGTNALERMRITSAGNVGIGTTTPSSRLTVEETKNTGPAGESPSSLVTLNVNNATAITGFAPIGFKSQVLNIGVGGITNNIAGVVGQAVQNGTGTINLANGVYGQIWNLSTGSITEGRTLSAPSPYIASTGTIGTLYGMYIGAQKVTGVTTGYGIYQSGATDLNYFSGKIGIGTTSPRSILEVNGQSYLKEIWTENGLWFGSFAQGAANTYISGEGANTGPQYLDLGVNFATRMRIADGGNVLINTTTDNGVDRLQVNGSIIATEIKKSGGTSSQFLKADGSIDSTVYAVDSNVVHKTGDETISGNKTFSGTTTLNQTVIRDGYVLKFPKGLLYESSISSNALTGNRTVSFPDESGTIALTSNLVGKYVTEATQTGIVFFNNPRANYGDIGIDAVDFSYSDTVSSVFGATGENSFAVGIDNVSSGYNSTTFGLLNINSSIGGFVTGTNNKGNGYLNSIFGAGHDVTGTNITVAGQASNVIVGSVLSNNVATDPVFVIGNGTVADNDPDYAVITRSDALIVRKNGVIEAPSLSIAEITAGVDKTLVTKEWAIANGGGGGTPGGTVNEIQYNDGAGGFAGAANVEIESGNLKLVSTTDPSPPTGGLLFYSKVVGGRTLPKIIGPSGIDTIMQVGLHGNSIFMVSPANATTAPNVIGGVITTATTISHQQTIASANTWQATRRTRFQTSTTAGNASGARTAYTQWFRGSAAGFGGFWFRCQLGMNINLQGGQKFVGLCNSTGALAGDPSALLNMCGMGYDAADLSTGSWFFMYNDGTGAATKVNLGANALRNTTHGYDLIMYMTPGGSELFVRIVNVATNVVVLETSYTTLLPVANTGMAFTAQVRNGAVAAADNIEIAKVYIETDY